MNQIPMRPMDLENAKAGIACATSGRGKRRDDSTNAIARERLRRRIIVGEPNRAWRHDVFPTAFALRNRAIAFPWPARARLATGVRQLHPSNTALLVNEMNDALERLDVIVTPDAEVLRANAGLRQDRCRFCHYKSCAANSPTTEMHEVPVVRQPINARVLTHRRDKH